MESPQRKFDWQESDVGERDAAHQWQEQWLCYRFILVEKLIQRNEMLSIREKKSYGISMARTVRAATSMCSNVKRAKHPDGLGDAIEMCDFFLVRLPIFPYFVSFAMP